MWQALFICILFLPGLAYAYSPVLVEQPSVFEIDILKDVTVEKQYFGTLEGFPETFEFLVKTPTEFYVQAMVLPDEDVIRRPSLILVQEVTRGVTEVMRRTASSERWADIKDDLTGITYISSSAYNEILEPGVYRLEVSNPENLGSYVIRMGTERESAGYVTSVVDTARAYQYAGSSWVHVLFTKLILVPLFAIVTLVFFVWYWRRKR